MRNLIVKLAWTGGRGGALSKLRPHVCGIDQAPSVQHCARPANQEDIRIRRRVSRKCGHERADALAIRYLAHCVARRKLATRRSNAL